MNISVLSYLAFTMLLLSISIDVKSTISRVQDVDVYQTIEGRNVDVCTQKGGKGFSVPSPPFCPAEEAILYANVTYNGWPEQNNDVAFQIFDPHETTFILSGRTDASGIAIVSFYLPSLENSEGIFGSWRIVTSVNIAGVTAIDILEFRVHWNLADINQDLKVDIHDAVLVCVAYGSELGDKNYSLDSDLCEPYGEIDLFDAVVILVNYGSKYG